MRYIIGDLTIRLCSGVFHRIETIKQAAANYDYNPYLVTKPGMNNNFPNNFYSNNCASFINFRSTCG